MSFQDYCLFIVCALISLRLRWLEKRVKALENKDKSS